uniref:DUF2500 domain-containing protein n=1 Tax=Thaumasiovibrio occultus TaxID=1891184 RepID=UPI000B35700A|nr:DUF2500 domain-containing protein [Thaumasiovibrio occultus]
MPVNIIIVLGLLFIASAAYCWFMVSRHMLGRGAREKKIKVQIIDKQSVPVENPFVGEDDEHYWIYVEPIKGGPKREFQIPMHYYHALEPGAKGVLTYKGHDFCHFALER